MADPTPTPEELTQRRINDRAAARVSLAEILAAIARWDHATHYLDALGLTGAPALRSALQDVYSATGNLLSELAPWKDRELGDDGMHEIRLPDEVPPSLASEPVPDEELASAEA